MKTLTINSTKQLKELVLGDPGWKGQYSLIIRNIRLEMKLFGQPVSTKMFNVNGKYVNCRLAEDVIADLTK